MEPKVVDFQVWQNFMPMVPASGAPLHAILTLEISSTLGLNTGNTGGTITITRLNGEVIANSKLSISEQSDDLGMAQPGPRRLTFVMGPAAINTRLTNGEMIQGTATVTLGDRRFDLKLPQTAVLFTY
jgi:hypothetical protein